MHRSYPHEDRSESCLLWLCGSVELIETAYGTQEYHNDNKEWPALSPPFIHFIAKRAANRYGEEKLHPQARVPE